MHWKKDWQKSKNILLAADIVLAVLVLAALGFCAYLLISINALPTAEAMEADIRRLQEETALLEERIEEKTAQVLRAEEESLLALETARETLSQVQTRFDGVSAEHAQLKAQADEFENAAARNTQLREDIARIRQEYGQTVRTLEDMILAGESDYRICYLTFDDGPSYLTSNFLDKLDELDVYVTFFTIGVQMGEKGQDLRNQLLRREALSGHALANHTYTHGIYWDLYHSIDIFMDSVRRQDELVYEVAGYHPDILRFPAGSYYCPFREEAIGALEEMGYGWIDWISNAYDSGTNVQESGIIVDNVIWQVSQDQVTVVLMHDWRSETLGALENIVTALKAKNYLFLPLFRESVTVGTARPRWDG